MIDLGFEISNERSRRLAQRLTDAGDLAAPYIGAAMRRTMFAFRRDFIRGAHKSDPVKFRRGGFNSPAAANATRGNVNSFLVETLPKSNEQKAKLNELEVSFYTRSKIAAALETGPTITPNAGGKWLAIPTGVALRANGKVKRYHSSPAMLKKYKKVETRFVQRSSSRAYVLLDVGRGKIRKKVYGPEKKRRKSRKNTSRWRIAWVLVRKVKIPAKLGFLEGWARLGPKYFDVRIEKEFRRYMREVWGQR